MRELVFLGPRQVRWSETPAPSLDGDLAALVRPVVVSTCDMDALALAGHVRFRGPTPLGHECVAEVVEIGDGVREVAVGDRVIVPWQISCGRCERCRRGQDAHCSSVPPGSCYGWGPHAERWRGFLAEQVLVPYADHMLTPLPHGLDPRRASGLSDNVVDAWRAVGGPLAETKGQSVLVVGGESEGGSIGLYAAGLARALGAPEVVFVSRSPLLCRRAAALGAEPVLAGESLPVPEARFDVTIDAGWSRDGLAFALRSTGPSGVCTSTAGALHRGADTPLPVYEMYMNVVTFHTGWVHTRALLAEPLELVAAGRFDPASIAEVVSWDDAESALAEPFTKLVLTR